MNVELTVKGDIEKLSLGPADILLITAPGLRNIHDLEMVAERIKNRIPEAWRDRILILGGDEISVKVATQS